MEASAEYIEAATVEEPTNVHEATKPWIAVGLKRSFTRAAILRALSRAANFVDSRPLLCVFLIVAALVPTMLVESYTHLLNNDEIYTLHIAQSPTLGQMLALSKEIDLHPPLHYLVERYSLMLPFPRWFDARLPSMIAGLVACLTIFFFIARRLGPLFGTVAVTVVWFGPLMEFTRSNRPYMLWLMFLCLLLPAREEAVRAPRRWWAVPAVFLAALGMVSSHLIGVMCLGPFLLAEAVRGYRNRRFDIPLLTALAIPVLMALGFHYQISHLSKDAFPLQQLPSFGLALETYQSNLGNAAVVLGVALLVFVLIFRPTVISRSREMATSSRLPFDLSERIILVGLVALPLFVLLVGYFLHVQFWTRYGAAALPAIAILAAALIACRFPLARQMAFLLVLVGLSFMGYMIASDNTPQTNAGLDLGGRTAIPLSKLDHSLPIVAASPMTFIEMSDREPLPIAHRVYYLEDVQQALRFSHYTLFENEDKIRALLNLPSHAEHLTSFLPQHHKFYVVGDYNSPQIWLLRSLAAAGLHLNYLGVFQSSYESQDLYLVSY